MANTQYDQLILDLQNQQAQSNLANQKRYDQMLAIYDETIDRYQPGGSFEKKFLQQLGKQKERYIGQETQDLVSSGLFNTTSKAAIGGKFEEQIGAPSRLDLEDIQMQRLTAAQMGKAGAIERVEDTGPGYDLIAQLAGMYGQGSNYMQDNPNLNLKGTGTGYGSGQSLNDWLKQEFGGYDPNFGLKNSTTPGFSYGSKSGQQEAQEAWEKKYANVPDWTPAPFTAADKQPTESEYQKAKAAELPWTYNYSTWKNAIRSGKSSYA